MAVFTLQEGRDDKSSEALGCKCHVVHPDNGWTLHSLPSLLRCLDDGLPVRQHKRVARTPLYAASNDHRDRVLLERHRRMAVSTQTERLKLVLLSRVAHTFRSLECMRHVGDVESRHAPAEAILRRQLPSFFNEEHPAGRDRARLFDSEKFGVAHAPHSVIAYMPEYGTHAPPAGQPPLVGGGTSWIGPVTMDPAVAFPGAIPIAPGVYIGPSGELVVVWTTASGGRGALPAVIAGGLSGAMVALLPKGYYFNPVDQALNRYHPGGWSFRQVWGTVCSSHAIVNETTGQVSSHVDTVNPVPAWPLLLGPAGVAVWGIITVPAHQVADIGGLLPASQVCQ
jgi:hypothetical protein